MNLWYIVLLITSCSCLAEIKSLAEIKLKIPDDVTIAIYKLNGKDEKAFLLISKTNSEKNNTGKAVDPVIPQVGYYLAVKGRNKHGDQFGRSYYIENLSDPVDIDTLKLLGINEPLKFHELWAILDQ